ncbi:hypothetical protein A4R28_21610 [Mesorhizobium ciceri]|nr:hypothetical protein A4R28_21610 [Mesorhizobium ciceri]
MRAFSLRPKFVGRNKVGKMPTQLVMIVVVETLARRVLDGAVHSLDLAGGPSMLWLRGSKHSATMRPPNVLAGFLAPRRALAGADGRWPKR